MWRNVKRNIIELRRYRVWTSGIYRASNWTSHFTWTADAASFLNNQSREIHTYRYSLLSAQLFTHETRRLKNVYTRNTRAMIVKISTGLCCDYFYQHERKVRSGTGHEGPEGGRGIAILFCTTLQTGRSRVRFPMVSFEFFSDIILPVALWPWGRFSL